jgi:hypothetical protein
MNDNNNTSPISIDVFPEDPRGAAALLLVESMLHGLCEHAYFSIEQGLEIADRAVEVQYEKASISAGEARENWRTHALLKAISDSLRVDLKRLPPFLVV